MKKNSTRIQNYQLKELQLISIMIEKGEPLNKINTRWKKFVEKSKNELVALEPEGIKVDVNEVINHILSETYVEANNDLQLSMQRVKFLDDMKRQIRDEITRTRQNMEDYIRSLEDKLSSFGDDSQLANIDLQSALQRQQQTIQTMSNVSKMLHDTAMSIIRNIG